MHHKLTEIDKDWERTNEVLVQIHQEVREACASTGKDEIRLKQSEPNKLTFKTFELARASGTEEDFNHISRMLGLSKKQIKRATSTAAFLSIKK